MAQLLDEVALECAICLNRYDNPLLLACSHSFCAPCIEDLIINKKNTENPSTRSADSEAGGGEKSITCPTCRQETIVSKAKPLPANYALRSILDSLKEVKEIQPKKSNGKICFNCAEGASLFCGECNLLMCKTCYETEHRGAVVRSHNVVSVVDAKFEVIPRCADHQEKKHLYCSKCEVLACPACVHLKHTGHSFKSIPEAAKLQRAKILNINKPVKKSIARINTEIEKKMKVKGDLELKIKELQKQLLSVDNDIGELNEKLYPLHQAIGTVKAVAAEAGDIALLEDKSIAKTIIENLTHTMKDLDIAFIPGASDLKWKPHNNGELSNDGKTFTKTGGVKQFNTNIFADIDSDAFTEGVHQWSVMVEEANLQEQDLMVGVGLPSIDVTLSYAYSNSTAYMIYTKSGVLYGVNGSAVPFHGNQIPSGTHVHFELNSGTNTLSIGVGNSPMKVAFRNVAKGVVPMAIPYYGGARVTFVTYNRVS